MNTLTQIQSELLALPVNLQAEVLDFVRFVKQRRGLAAAVPGTSPATSESSDSPFFQALTEAGFVGCIDTDDQLSTRYKSQLDFSAKVGAQP
ncbi:MAG: hypothetical protein JZU64_04045 [Rhodoferax sp.]|jgi:hypothetical protein|nr:hypothetical protein [Rhodoferax sp.]